MVHYCVIGDLRSSYSEIKLSRQDMEKAGSRKVDQEVRVCNTKLFIQRKRVSMIDTWNKK